MEQEATLSKSLPHLPVKHPRLTTGLEVWGPGAASSTHLVAEAGVGWHHGGVKDMHLLQLHVTVELLQLRGLHALQLRELVIRVVLELVVYMVCGEVPVMICGDSQGGGAEPGCQGR